MRTANRFSDFRSHVLSLVVLVTAAVVDTGTLNAASRPVSVPGVADLFTVLEGEPPAPEESSDEPQADAPDIEPDKAPDPLANPEGLPPAPIEDQPSPEAQTPPRSRGVPLDGAPPAPVEPEATSESPPAADSTPPTTGDEPEPSVGIPKPIVLKDYLILRPVDQFRRAPFQEDAIEAAVISGDWQPPKEGENVEGSSGTRRQWQVVQAAEDGYLRDDALRGGYAFVTYESPREQVALLHARGHSMVYVNGVPRAGDPYDNGWLRLPIQLREGTNEFLFHVARVEMLAQLEFPTSPALLDHEDTTLPDLIVGEEEPKWAAVWVINASDEPLSGAKLVCQGAGGATLETTAFEVPPLSVRKMPFQLDGNPDPAAESVIRTVQLVQTDGDEPNVRDELSFGLRSIQPTEPHVRTFISEIDGSVQQYAVQPASSGGTGTPGLILALHGAAIDAATHASYYSSKAWAHVVAPTNRRPYGFDWEDWGRMDALEALSDAQKHLEVDARRLYLTGHSMGGHGAWHLGATYPGRFAAVAPSAGWISFETYTTAGSLAEAPTAGILERAANPSQTLALKTNLAAAGVYVLHGSDDQSVPVNEARRMREELGGFHGDFAYYERPGGGHWWGEESVDWSPMMDFFQHHELPQPKDVRRIEFTTMNPGISARSGWLTIEAQAAQLAPSTATIECDVEEREFLGTTSNVARLALDVSHLEPGSSIRVELDNQRLRDVRWPNVTRTIWLERDGPRWRTTDPPSPDVKGPHRYGLFKDAFRNRPVLVFGTRGTEEEDRWAFARARFDGETFLYRGNGTLEVVSDREFNPTEYEDRNVILYGNADTNSAWPALLSTCPIQVRRGSIRLGLRSESGEDVACVFIYPRQGSSTASVGVVSGTGLEGLNLTNRLRYFVSGVAYPDLVIFDSSVLREGAGAVRAAGFFGLDWQLDSGDIAWRDLAL